MSEFITQRIYRELFEIRTKRGLYSEIDEEKFAGIPLFWVLFPHDHFYIAGALNAPHA